MFVRVNDSFSFFSFVVIASHRDLKLRSLSGVARSRQEMWWDKRCVDRHVCSMNGEEFRCILCSSYFSGCYKEILTLAHGFRGLVKDGREVRAEQLCRWWEHVVKSSHMVEGTREQRDTGRGQRYHTPSTRPFFPVAYFPKLSSTCQNFQNPPKIKPLA